MSKSTRDITKSPKKRAVQTGDPVMVRLQPELARPLDTWRRKQEDQPGRPEAIRRLVEIGLGKALPSERPAPAPPSLDKQEGELGLKAKIK